MRPAISLLVLMAISGCSHPADRYAKRFVEWDARSDAENVAGAGCNNEYKLIPGRSGLLAEDYECLTTSLGSVARWRRLSETDQGPRFIDLSSAQRNGDVASVDTELRMEPVIKRREHFDCARRMMLVDTYIVTDLHDPKLVPSGQDWTPVTQTGDGVTMLEIACGNDQTMTTIRSVTR